MRALGKKVAAGLGALVALLAVGLGLVKLVRSSAVIWADGVVVAPDGTILFTDSAIPAFVDQLARPLHAGS